MLRSLNPPDHGFDKGGITLEESGNLARFLDGEANRVFFEEREDFRVTRGRKRESRRDVPRIA